MEVSGKKVRKAVKLCSPCHKNEFSTYADGFCTHCSKHMCKTCFDTHKQLKFNRSHQWVNSREKTSKGKRFKDFVICERHTKGFIKFFCSHHDQVGCGDCMTDDHKSCKVEYILDKLIDHETDDNETFKQLTKDVQKSRLEANTLLTSIRTNRDQIKYINKMFNCGVITFKEDIMAHITKLTNSMLSDGQYIMMENLENMDKLEKENERIITEMSNISETLQSLKDQHYKMFVSTITHKETLHQVQHQLEKIKENNNIKTYVFERDVDLERSVKDTDKLGNLREGMEEEATKLEIKEGITGTKVKTKEKKAPAPQRRQSLLDRKLFCKNLTIDDNFIGYSGKRFFGGVGMFIDKIHVDKGYSCDAEILNKGNSGSIAIGIVTEFYSDKCLPGLQENSIGHHSNGKLYIGGVSQKTLLRRAWKIGDCIGCRIKDNKNGGFNVTILQNGLPIGQCDVLRGKYHFAIGMKSSKDEVEVILDA